MELGLRLGDDPRALGFRGSELALSLGLGVGEGVEEENGRGGGGEEEGDEEDNEERGLEEPLRLDLLPLLPCSFRFRSSSARDTKSLNVNRTPSAEKGAMGSSSPNGTSSSFLVADYSVCDGGGGREGKGETAAPLRLSDEDENGMTRKKLRLSKDQSGFLEESFKEHSTLNPKEKVALAKQLNLQPRQVEVWFQNRRARTKLKQTEVDYEYLKRRCQTLTEENRRLHKELAELRALNISHSFYTHVPATTLSMCPSCKRVTSTTAASKLSAAAAAADQRPNSLATLFSQSDPSKMDSQPAAAALHQPSHAF